MIVCDATVSIAPHGKTEVHNGRKTERKHVYHEEDHERDGNRNSIRSYLLNEGTWKLINRIFFQDITQEKGFYSLGLFYIIQQLFMRGLQLAIVPLVLSSLSLALCSMADPKRLGKIAGKTIGTFVGFYVCGATLAGLFAYFIKSMGWFSVNLPETTTSNVATLEAYNPLTTVINAVPSNVVEVLGSNNSILAVVV